MEYIRKGFRRVKNRIVNRPAEVQKRYYLQLREKLDPLRKPGGGTTRIDRPVLMISGITMRGTGFFCNMLAFLRWVDFAQRMNYIPVIDMQNVENLYLEDDLLGRVNAYEYFYKQPGGLSVEEGYCAEQLYIVNRLDCPYDFTRRQKKCYRDVMKINDWVYGENREKYFDRIKAVYDRYFVMNDELAAFVDARYRELIAPNERTIGLLCRGTDYFAKRPYKHQIQPTAEQIIQKTDETLAAHPADKSFVATEDADILAALKAKYDEKLVYIDCPRLTAVQGQSVAEGFAERGVDKKMNGWYYFASIAILARCDHLIAGKTMATQFIRTMRDTPFETEFYWNLGRYGVDDKK